MIRIFNKIQSNFIPKKKFSTSENNFFRRLTGQALGPYSIATIVSNKANLIFLSGAIGVDLNVK